ncbi:glycoside hydrolase [Micromonospora sp. KC213]|uniref:glycoside hydrolase n=1 Tax=Micromonospora sp. KC213 TaxID=2530378 RepID=UPI001A9E6128|nr:glycoside hydrolase [Micromonospora sp. KC213]
MTGPSTPSRLASVLTATAMAVAAAAVGSPPAVATTGTAAEIVPTVVVTPDPSYRQPAWEGWGTSLVWFANATGGYPDEIRNHLVDLLFGADGLRLNMARYNIGGGNAPDVRTDYMKVGATMPGFWTAPPGTTRTDVDWWNPDDPEHWNWDADANQRWWVDQIKDRVDTWEAFSNSPPYFQTVSGYVSGGFNSSADQIRADRVDDFATYLVRVTEHLEAAHGIEFHTIEPLNEPNTSYWGTQLGPDGQPTGGRQEGAHASPALQQQVILALARRLENAQTRARLAAMDETNPGTFVTNWNDYRADTRAVIDQLNVHTYGTGQRTSARDVAKGADKPLWMSEVDGHWGTGQSFTSMDPGLGIAERIVGDLRELEPSAWMLWQPIEDYNPQHAGNKNWGAIQIPFDCTAQDTLQTCPARINTKFHTLRNFTHHIRPGDHVIEVNDTASVAAVSANGRAATVVHVNSADTGRRISLDLSRFGHVTPEATVTPIVTDASGALVRQRPIPVDKKSAAFTVPAKSVTTFVVDGVQGVADDAALVRAGHVYRLQGVPSGRSLTPAGSSVVIRTSDALAADQLWRITPVTATGGNRSRYLLSTGDRSLVLRDGSLTLERSSTALAADPVAQWILSTTGDGTYTLVNAATGRLIDVSDHATADGSRVGTWTPTSQNNQRWTIVDETVLSTVDTAVFTTPGTPPVLPATVTPVHPDGARGLLPVVWRTIPHHRWSKPGTVTVLGTATDPLGRRIAARAVVTVDTVVATEPARAKAYPGGRPNLPTTVTGVGASGARVLLPVTWSAPPAYERTGVFELSGTATVPGGSTQPATARVQVTTPVLVNAATDSGVQASATYTESGYSADRLRNGVSAEKGWSNWRSGTKNSSDTLTFQLPSRRDAASVTVHFHRDGNSDTYAQSLRAEVRDATGAWVRASAEISVPGGAPAPALTVPLSAVTTTDGVRVVLTARPGLWMTVGEVQILTAAPGRSSDAALSALHVNGKALPGFTPDVLEYTLPASGQLTATPRDPYAGVSTALVRAERTATVTVTSEDGTQTRTYRVRFRR